MKKYCMILALASLLPACSKVDDYLLGKDNTPKPSELETITPKVTMAQKWTLPVGSSRKTNAYLKLKPVIQDQIIYTADPGGRIEAINTADAKAIWSTNLKQGIVSGPSISGSNLAVTTNASTVVLLNSVNGHQLWEAKISSEALGKPAIAAQKVIVKSIDGNLYAFNLSNGEKLWTVNHGAPNLILKASASPVVYGSTVLVGYSDGKLDAVDLESGRTLWQRSIAYATGSSDVERLVDIDADPIIRDDIAYLAAFQGYIGALSLKNGEFIWNKPASVYKNITLGSNTLYATDSEDTIWAINLANGSVRWKQDALQARGLTEPVLMGKNLVVGDKTGLLHILGTQTGELLGRSKLSGPIDIPPVIVNNKLYVQTANGLLNQLVVS